MNSVFAVGSGGSSATSACLAFACGVLLVGASAPALAEEPEPEPVTLAQAGTTGSANWKRPQLEVSAIALPRFDNTDGSTRSARLDMTLLPPRRSALGLSLGMTSNDASSLAVATPPRLGLQQPSVDLGLHWRHQLDNNYRFDVTAWRRLMPADTLTLVQQRDSYGARVEMKIGSSVPKSGFAMERGFVGLQLESGARITVKRNGGKPMVYYRSKF